MTTLEDLYCGKSVRMKGISREDKLTAGLTKAAGNF